jgi:hypothetical protein
LFHLPRTMHADLFYNIHRILEANGKLLFTVPDGEAGEGLEEDWLGTTMYECHFV